MFKILKKESLNSSVSHMRLEAPLIANKALPGQFIILIVDEKGERIPLTIYESDKKAGTIDIIYQKIGATTMKLDQLNESEFIKDVVGPLGKPTNIHDYHNVIVVMGGVGSAIAIPLARALKDNNSKVQIIAGFRSKDLIILENEMRLINPSCEIVTDDGSNGNKGVVTKPLEEKLKKSTDYDLIITVGPLPMMKAVCDLTKIYGVKTIVSMNSIMIDGTGMCGGCRLTVDGKVKFACVDGPDFDGHLVDFSETISRNNTFKEEEFHYKTKKCNLGVEI